MMCEHFYTVFVFIIDVCTVFKCPTQTMLHEDMLCLGKRTARQQVCVFSRRLIWRYQRKRLAVISIERDGIRIVAQRRIGTHEAGAVEARLQHIYRQLQLSRIELLCCSVCIIVKTPNLLFFCWQRIPFPTAVGIEFRPTNNHHRPSLCTNECQKRLRLSSCKESQSDGLICILQVVHLQHHQSVIGHLRHLPFLLLPLRRHANPRHTLRLLHAKLQSASLIIHAAHLLQRPHLAIRHQLPSIFLSANHLHQLLHRNVAR